VPRPYKGNGKKARKEKANKGVELAAEEFFEEEAREAAGVVAENAMFFEEIIEDDAEAEFVERRKIDGHGFGALHAITAGHIGRNGLAIGDDPVNDTVGDVLLDGAEMVGEGVAGGFAGLSHQIGDVDSGSPGLGDGAGNFRDEQIGNNTGVERARPKKNQVRFLDSFDGAGKRTHAAGGQL